MHSLKTLLVLLAVLATANASSHGVFRSAHRRHHARAAHAQHAARDATCSRRSRTASTASASATDVAVPSSAAASAPAHTSSTPSSTRSRTRTRTSSSSPSSTASSPAAARPTASASSALSTKNTTAAPALTPLLAALFPLPDAGAKSWTTAAGAAAALPLSDATLRPHSDIAALAHPYAPFEGKTAMQAHYPAGSFNFKHEPLGGLSFYSSGPASVDIATAKELTFGYSVFFPAGFDFVKGGKLPGVYAGDSDALALSCSGGRRSDQCMSARLMWRTDGAGEMYTYLPPSAAANDAVCSVAPMSECNPTYGASIARGSFTFATGAWTTVSERVKLNDVGQENGELELFVGGKSMFSVGGLVLRTSDAGRFRGIQMQTFFGGSDKTWATPTDQDTYFADFSLAITQTL